MELHWTADPQTEYHLRKSGLPWQLVDIHLSQIDVALSRKNNARLDTPLNNDVALDYACALESGAIFPAIVVVKGPRNHYIVVSGNHRVGAVEILLGDGILTQEQAVFNQAYLLTTDDPAMVELVTRAANRWQGRRQGRDEALEHIKWMVARHNLTLAQCAKTFSIPQAWIKSRLQATEARTKLHELDVPTTHLSDAAVVKLNQLGFNQKLQTRAAFVAQELRLKNEEVKGLVDAVRRSSQESEQAGMTALKAIETQHCSTKLKAQPGTTAAERPVRSRFVTQVKSLDTLMHYGNKGQAFTDLRQLQVAGRHDRHAIHEVWKRVKKKIDTLFHDAQQRDR